MDGELISYFGINNITSLGVLLCYLDDTPAIRVNAE